MFTVIAIGELLWDEFEDGRRLGGAPANVAFHCGQAGLRAGLLSCVGDDEAGREAVRRLAEAGVDCSLVAVDAERPTGRVTVVLDAADAPRYTIHRNVAWDRIPWRPQLAEQFQQTRAVVFGTLSQRDAGNRVSIASALDAAPQALKVLDLNFRPPFVDGDIVRRSLEAADILKLNEDELKLLPGLIGLEPSDDLAGDLIRRFGLRRLYLTRGGDGCTVFGEGDRVAAKAPPVAVQDAVGAGDSFTAALIHGELNGHAPGRIGADACAVGAFVASRRGAMPRWPDALKQRLRA